MNPDCGTDAGYKQHHRRRQPPCAACLAAHSRHARSRYHLRQLSPQRSPDPIAIARAVAGHPPEHLTRAERAAAIAQLLGQGHSHAEIARRLRISARTVLRHSRKVT